MKYFLITLAFLLSSCYARDEASYGEPCNKSNPNCIKSANLVCIGGRCLCNATEAIYDLHENICIGKAGASFLKYSECVQNAFKDVETGLCKCKSYVYESLDGLCPFKKRYGEDCDRNEACEGTGNFICAEGKCSCNETESFVDLYHFECVGKVGQPRAKYSGNMRNICVLNTKEDTDLCECNDRSKESEDGRCFGGHGTQCRPTDYPCVEGLSCDNGRCDCPFPEHQVHSGHFGCKSLVNGPCLEIIGGKVFQFECDDGAECRSDSGHPECLCKEGYIKSKSGQCKKSYCKTSYPARFFMSGTKMSGETGMCNRNERADVANVIAVKTL